MFMVSYIAVGEDGLRYHSFVEGAEVYDYITAQQIQKKYPDSEIVEVRLKLRVEPISRFSRVRFVYTNEDDAEAKATEVKNINTYGCTWAGKIVYVYDVPCTKLHQLCKAMDVYTVGLLSYEHKDTHMIKHGGYSYGDTYYTDNNIEVQYID